MAKSTLFSAFVAFWLSTLAIAAPGPITHFVGVQKPDLTLPSDANTHRDAVKDIFLEAYATYKRYAWGHDDVAPISRGFVDSRNGWGASIIDSMSTMAVMGLEDLFNEATEFVRTVNFTRSKTPDTVNLFETTIRYLGGLLSAYELHGEQDQILVDKAKEVADRLSIAWVGSNTIPFNDLNFNTSQPRIQNSGIAVAGTLALEWGTLTKHTGNDTYRRLGEGALRHVANLPAPLPGLAAQGLDPRTGRSVGGYITWGGGSDSYFEYLLKYGRLTNNADPLFVQTWTLAVDSSIRYLAKTSTVGNHLYLADYTEDRRVRYISSHLACFHGGNWIMGGKLVGNETIVDYGIRLVDACLNTYDATASGFGPEAFSFESADGNWTGGPARTPADQEFYNEHGFYVYPGYGYYILRPEVLESNFIAYRVTGDKKYYDYAARAIESYRQFIRLANGGYSGLTDVRNPGGPRFDHTESFFYAEVLKYLYLTFDDPKHISLDDWVFNTEAHPYKAPEVSTDGLAVPRLPPQDQPFRVTEGPVPEISPLSVPAKGIADILRLPTDN